MGKILILGAAGQVGMDLTQKLIHTYGLENVIASDIKIPENYTGQFIQLDASDFNAIYNVVKQNRISTIYHLVAMLSATAEKQPVKGWNLNMTTLFNVLEMAKNGVIKQIFWPSSIAVFGPNTPKFNTPQKTIIEPTTIYGISKYAGELLCQWYYMNHKVDVRSLRYPGIISWKSEPGGGTTDYAVDIFYKALQEKYFQCFLNADTRLPMMYIDDAIDATIQIMESDFEKIKNRTSYNITGFDITPSELYQEIKKYIPDFKIEYIPDFRQKIADNWPQSIDDSEARNDWQWHSKYDLQQTTQTMLHHLKQKLGVTY